MRPLKWHRCQECSAWELRKLAGKCSSCGFGRMVLTSLLNARPEDVEEAIRMREEANNAQK